MGRKNIQCRFVGESFKRVKILSQKRRQIRYTYLKDKNNNNEYNGYNKKLYNIELHCFEKLI